MRGLLQLRYLPILAGWAVLSGCSWFSSAPEIPSPLRRIDLQIKLDMQITLRQ